MTQNPTERLNKYLSRSKNITREEADLLISSRAVEVNGILAVIGQTVSRDDKISVETNKIVRDYFVYNKPVDIVSNNDLVQDFTRKTKTFIANPLTREESGLVVITNDGRFSEEIRNGRYDREYQIEAEVPLKESFLLRLEKGFYFLGSRLFAKRIKYVNSHTIQAIFQSEKKNFISQLAKIFNLKNARIKRIRLANLSLFNLPENSIKSISKHDLEILFGILNFRTIGDKNKKQNYKK